MKLKQFFYFRFINTSNPKNLHFNAQTILFHSSNTCVWFLKQYCFTSQTILFHPGKFNLWSVKVKCFEFHSLEDGMGLQFVL